MTTPLPERIEQLTRSRIPFVQATVVRAQEPSSAHPGDRAVVLQDGSIEGFVGGQCAAGSVRTAALDALERGDSVLLRVVPDSGDFPQTPGARVVVNPCLSGGALEIYLEPQLPPPSIYVVGSSPTAEEVVRLAGALGYAVQRAEDAAEPGGAVAAVVSSHGGDEAAAVRRALDADVGFVGLVCSRTRGKALLAELDLGPEQQARVHPHVGLDIGARTPAEVAVSIMAAVVRAVRVDGLVAAPDAPALSRPLQAVDPVCGMMVTVLPDTPHLRHEGVDHWFCNPGCRDAFAASVAS